MVTVSYTSNFVLYTWFSCIPIDTMVPINMSATNRLNILFQYNDYHDAYDHRNSQHSVGNTLIIMYIEHTHYYVLSQIGLFYNLKKPLQTSNFYFRFNWYSIKKSLLWNFIHSLKANNKQKCIIFSAISLQSFLLLLLLCHSNLKEGNEMK